MPISVTLSKQLDVDLTQAEEGELLMVHLDDRSTLLLTARRYYKKPEDMSFIVEPAHMPLALREHIKQQVRYALGGDLHGLRSWYEKQEDQSPGLYQMLYTELSSRCEVYSWEVGNTPEVVLRSLGSTVDFRPVRWKVPAVVTNLTPVQPWQGVLEEAKIQVTM